MYCVSTPKPSSLSAATLASEPIVTLPAVAPAAMQGYGPVASHELSEALAASIPSLHEIPPIQTLNRVNAAGLMSDYGEMMAGFSRTGMFDRRQLNRIGTALGAKYVLQPGLADFVAAVMGRADRGDSVGSDGDQRVDRRYSDDSST